MPWHDLKLLTNFLVISTVLIGLLFIGVTLSVWALLSIGKGGTFKDDVQAYMKRHGKQHVSLLLLIAALIFDPGLQAVFLYRTSSVLARHGLTVPALALHLVCRLITGASISPHAEIGGGLEIFHACGLCIGKDVKIGRNAWLFQNVTIGSSGKQSPILGNEIKVFAGAVVAGGIKIGDGAIIGANAVVISNIPAKAMVESPVSSIRIQERDVPNE